MDHRLIASILEFVRSLPRQALALLVLPIEAILGALEWIVSEVVARLLVLPLLLALHVWRHAVSAWLDGKRRLHLARARSATLPIEAEAAARLRHFEAMLAAIDAVDRAYARLDFIHPEASEATQAAFTEAMRGLREAALAPDAQELLRARLAAVFADGGRAA